MQTNPFSKQNQKAVGIGRPMLPFSIPRSAYVCAKSIATLVVRDKIHQSDFCRICIGQNMHRNMHVGQ